LAPESRAGGRRYALAVCGVLFLTVGLVFGQTVCHGFINLDDAEYVSENPLLTSGVSAEGVVRALTESHHCNWCPLTWWSYMLDYQLCGLKPWGYHLTNVLLHAASAMLLFLVLREMTGRFWPSALVAALFAVHPLRAESVAWVAERKDVLSGLFFMLTLGAYVRYARHRFSLVRYLTMMACFVLGLMAKPMLVTLPFVLLLLDYWPLGRIPGRERRAENNEGETRRRGDKETGESQSAAVSPCLPVSWSPSLGRPFSPRVIWEKIPLLALAGVACGLTLWAQRDLILPAANIPYYWRIGNSLVSYVAYLRQFFCPTGLALWYPLLIPNLQIWKILGCFGLLTAVTAGALVGWRRHPYVLVGWLWYVGMLVPAIGLVQVTGQAMADRFTYLPQIGLCIALVWGLADQRCGWLKKHWVCGVTSTLVVPVLMACAWRQASFWRNDETLWRRTLDCTSDNVLAQHHLGVALAKRGRLDEAVSHFRTALEIRPDYAEVHNSLGSALATGGRLDEAISHFRRASEIWPGFAGAHVNLALALAARGRLDEAIRHFQRASEIWPTSAEVHVNLGVALAARGRLDEAISEYGKALKIRPDFAEAHNHLGSALAGRGRLDEAIAQFRRAVAIRPNFADALNDLAWVLATCPTASLRDGAEAVELARRAEQLTGGRRVEVLDTLAAAYAEAGRSAEAVATARQALELATQKNDPDGVKERQSRLALYRARKPYHQSPAPP
jgi:Flp pilus assembly protein TadD